MVLGILLARACLDHTSTAATAHAACARRAHRRRSRAASHCAFAVTMSLPLLLLPCAANWLILVCSP